MDLPFVHPPGQPARWLSTTSALEALVIFCFARAGLPGRRNVTATRRCRPLRSPRAAVGIDFVSTELR